MIEISFFKFKEKDKKNYQLILDSSEIPLLNKGLKKF